MKIELTKQQKIVNETQKFILDDFQDSNCATQESVPDNLGKQLKAYRIKMTYTQKYFASLLKLSVSTISRYETNRQKPSIKTTF